MMRSAANNIKNQPMPAGVKALIFDDDSNRRSLIEELLANIGYSTVGCVSQINQLSEKLTEHNNKQSFDLLIVCQTQVHNDFLEQLKQTLAGYSVPVMMLSEDNSVEAINGAINAGIHNYLVLGVQGNRIKFSVDTAFANFRVIHKLQQKITELQNTLQNRITIEKAKGVIMKNKQLDENKAYTYLRNYSMERSLKIIDVANMVNATEELMN